MMSHDLAKQLLEKPNLPATTNDGPIDEIIIIEALVDGEAIYTGKLNSAEAYKEWYDNQPKHDVIRLY